MAERFQLPIPFWRMQYQLLGGHRKVLFLTLLYTAVVVIGAIAFQRMMRKEPLSQVCALIVNALLAIQAFLIVAGGANTIHRALLRDYETKMTESHRLTPMSNVGVVLGYLIGPNLLVLLVFTVTLFIGLIVSAIGKMPLLPWVVGNVFILCAASTIWAIIVFTGMRTAKPTGPAWIIFGTVGMTFPIVMIPGLGLMLGVYTVFLGIFITTGHVSERAAGTYVIAGVNLILTCFWTLAAAAKYRRPDLPALNGTRALVLLLLWLVIAVGGLIGTQAALTAGYKLDFAEESIAVQWIGTLIITLIFTTIAALGATECRLALAEGRQARGWGDRLPDWGISFAAALLASGALASLTRSIWNKVEPVAAQWGHWPDHWAMEAWCATTTAFLLGTLTARAVYFLLRLRFNLKSPLITLWGLLVLFWSLPALDAARANAVTSFEEPIRFSLLSTITPTGVMSVLWTDTPAPVWTGLGSQFALLVLLAFLARPKRR